MPVSLLLCALAITADYTVADALAAWDAGSDKIGSYDIKLLSESVSLANVDGKSLSSPRAAQTGHWRLTVNRDRRRYESLIDGKSLFVDDGSAISIYWPAAKTLQLERSPASEQPTWENFLSYELLYRADHESRLWDALRARAKEKAEAKSTAVK